MIQKEVELPDINEDFDGYERGKQDVIDELEELGFQVTVESEEPVGP